MPLTLHSNPSSIAKAYDAYVDRLHDEYYAEGPCCPECDAELDTEGDRWGGQAWCPECDYTHSWDNVPEDDPYEEYDGYVGQDA